jgi:thioredoxin-dependent peroxiredoxin
MWARAKMTTLHVNDKAPLFSAKTDSGETFSLADHLGKSNIVLYFYPKDFTTGCTKEGCAFRDKWDKVISLGATVLGVSSDSVESHKAFKEQYKLPFTLLSDDNNQEIRKQYGVKGLLIPSRVTFVIDRRGVIRDIFNSQINFREHIDNALRVLSEINREEKEINGSTATVNSQSG